MSYSGALREELNRRAEAYSRERTIPYYKSLGTPPTILFSANAEKSIHGNFIDSSYRQILADPKWRARLMKPHPRKDALPPRWRETACELDSCTSSDALLMNIFCHPALGPQAEGFFAIASGDRPAFGVCGKIRFRGGRFDSTELDMAIGQFICEAKLTEQDFTQCSKSHLETYGSFSKVFEAQALPQTSSKYDCYQLIRNILAAYEQGCQFRVLVDRRRPDLLDYWSSVRAAIKVSGLRNRCAVIFWQQLASKAPSDLKRFLEVKYGIEGNI